MTPSIRIWRQTTVDNQIQQELTEHYRQTILDNQIQQGLTEYCRCSYRECHLQYSVNPCCIWLSKFVCLHVPAEGVIYSVPSIPVVSDCPVLFVFMFYRGCHLQCSVNLCWIWLSNFVCLHVPMEESIRSILSIYVASDCQMLFVFRVLWGGECYIQYSTNLRCIWLSNVVFLHVPTVVVIYSILSISAVSDCPM